MKLDALPPPLITLDTDGVTMQLMEFSLFNYTFPPTSDVVSSVLGKVGHVQNGGR